MRPWRHPLPFAALLLVAAAIGVLVGGLADELVVPSAIASTATPTNVGRYHIVWARRPAENAPIECYIAREATLKRSGVWLCG